MSAPKSDKPPVPLSRRLGHGFGKLVNVIPSFCRGSKSALSELKAGFVEEREKMDPPVETQETSSEPQPVPKPAATGSKRRTTKRANTK